MLKDQEAGDDDGRCLPQAQRRSTKNEAQFGGLRVSDARRLRPLENENVKLKKLLAEAMLDRAILKDVASRKW